jgi:hypothetical protein
MAFTGARRACDGGVHQLVDLDSQTFVGPPRSGSRLTFNNGMLTESTTGLISHAVRRIVLKYTT